MQSLTNPKCQIARAPRNFVEVVSISRVTIYYLCTILLFLCFKHGHFDRAAEYVLEMMLVDSELKWPITEQKSFKVVP